MLAGGGVLAALLAALVKGLLARAGASAYALMMLLAWGGGGAAGGQPPAGRAGRPRPVRRSAVFHRRGHLLATALVAVVVLPALAWLSRPLLLARLPGVLPGPGRRRAPRLMLFDLLAGLVVALATVSLGVMAAFALVFVPPLLGWRFGRAGDQALVLAALSSEWGLHPAFALSSGSISPSARYALRFWLCSLWVPACEIRQDVNHVARAC